MKVWVPFPEPQPQQHSLLEATRKGLASMDGDNDNNASDDNTYDTYFKPCASQ
jgi:hypothetical protein